MVEQFWHDDLESLREAAQDYVTTFRKNKCIPSLKSCHKGYINQMKSKFKEAQKSEAEKVTTLISKGPNTRVNCDLLRLFEQVGQDDDVFIKIPESLKISPLRKQFYYTKNAKICRVSGAKSVDEFFSKCKSLRQESAYTYPKYIYYSNSTVSLIYSDEDALDKVKYAKNCVLQRFIYPKGQYMSKVRLHWKEQSPPTFYVISNKQALPRRSLKIGLDSCKKETSNASQVLSKIQHLIFAQEGISYQINAPSYSPIRGSTGRFKVKSVDKAVPSCEESIIHNKLTSGLDTTFYAADTPYLLRDSMPDLWTVRKCSKLSDLPVTMAKTLASLLNNYEYNERTEKTKELVLDFIRDTKKQWYLFGVAQFSSTKRELKRQISQMSVICPERIPITPLSKKSLGTKISGELGKLINKVEFNSSIFKKTLTQGHSNKYFEELRNKQQLVNEIAYTMRRFQSTTPNSRHFAKLPREVDAYGLYRETRHIDQHGRTVPMILTNPDPPRVSKGGN